MQLTNQVQIIIQHLIEVPAFLLWPWHRIMGRCRLTAPILNRPTNTGLSSSSAGCMPPRSYQGDRNALHPMGLMTLTVFLIHTLPHSPRLSGSASPDTWFLQEHSIPASKTSSRWLSRSMQVFVIQKDNLREKYRLFAALFALPFRLHIQHSNRSQALQICLCLFPTVTVIKG